MSTYRFPLRGRIGVIRGRDGDVVLRLMGERRRPEKMESRAYPLNDREPLTEEEIRNLPVAHRYSA